MTRPGKFRKLFAYVARHLAVMAYPIGLVACNPDIAERDEIFIEAIPNQSSLFALHSGRDKKADTLQEPIQIHFDQNAYFTNATSSLLYRGGYLSYVRDQGHLKLGSVLVANRTASWQGPLLTLPPLEGRSYNASVWVKLIETDQATRIKLILTRVSDGTITNLLLNEIQAEPRTWQKVEGEFIGNSQSDSDINTLSLEVDNADISYLVDDIVVSYAELSATLQAAALATTTKKSDFVTNGSVEEGLEPWSHQGGVISRSTSYAHTGEHSLLIAGRKQEWNAPVIFVKGLEDRKLYRFSIFVRLSDGQPSANVKLTLKRTTAGQTTFISLATGHATSTVWTEMAGTFSASNISESERVSVYLECEDPTASYFVDTFTVEEVTTH